MSRPNHHPRCAIYEEPPSLRSANDCNCGAIPPLVDPNERIGELEFLLQGEKLVHRKDNEYLLGKIAAYESALDLIAAPRRADGTYNRSREACEQLAKEVLKKWRTMI